MKKNKDNIYLFLLLSALLVLLSGVAFAQGLYASIGNPKKVLYPQFTSDDPYELQETLLVKNRNNISTKITLTAINELTGLVEFDENPFYLAPNTEREVKMLITLPKPGIYEGKISVMFQADERENPQDKRSLILASNFIIFASDKNGFVPNVHPNAGNNQTPLAGIRINATSSQTEEEELNSITSGETPENNDYVSESDNDEEGIFNIGETYRDNFFSRLKDSIFTRANPIVGSLISLLILGLGLLIYFLLIRK